MVTRSKQFLNDKFAEVDGKPKHSLGVYEILRDDFGVKDKNVLVAGMLHDVLEDTKTTKLELKREFGEVVANLVEEVSHPPNATELDYDEFHERLLSVSEDAKVIKLADELCKLKRTSIPYLEWLYRRKVKGSWSVATEKAMQDFFATVEDSDPKKQVLNALEEQDQLLAKICSAL